ncbi:hypothetical protein SKAU_G00237300 [Synaphobranchus kaupii]|uniref:Uncharacterized protein n=1 Tax=Synaphobranchus kaupii TaxID=118154 RepID=A0A9Q1ITV9_SYNKA|nr:hypothetical protein SKAU_G00237300 [Synaphobranchus kaupii]
MARRPWGQEQVRGARDGTLAVGVRNRCRGGPGNSVQYLGAALSLGLGTGAGVLRIARGARDGTLAMGEKERGGTGTKKPGGAVIKNPLVRGTTEEALQSEVSRRREWEGEHPERIEEEE